MLFNLVVTSGGKNKTKPNRRRSMHKSKMQAISIVNLDCKEKKRFFRDHQLEECSLMSRALLQHVCEISERKLELVLSVWPLRSNSSLSLLPHSAVSLSHSFTVCSLSFFTHTQGEVKETNGSPFVTDGNTWFTRWVTTTVWLSTWCGMATSCIQPLQSTRAKH